MTRHFLKLQYKLGQILIPFEIQLFTQSVPADFYAPDGDVHQLRDFLGIQVKSQVSG